MKKQDPVSNRVFTDAKGKTYILPEGERVARRVSVYPIVFNHKDELLVYMPEYNPQWQLPGGGQDDTLNETLHETAERECLEETGYHIKIHDKNPFYTGKQNFYHKREKKFYFSEQLFFKSQLLSNNRDEVSTEDKNGYVSWKRLEDLGDTNTHPIIHPVITLLRRGV